MKFIAPTLTITALAFPLTVHAAGILECSGEHIWHGEGLSDKFTLTAFIENSETLSFIEDHRNEEGDLTHFHYPSLKADAFYKPNGKRYEGFNRFALEGGPGQTKYFLLLPKDLGSQATLKGFIQRTGPDTYPTVRLTCEITGLGL